MAESGRICVECGRLVAMFSGITINDASFHGECWLTGRRLIPKAGQPESPGKPSPPPYVPSPPHNHTSARRPAR